MEQLRLERQIHAGLTLGRLKDGQIALVRGGLPEETVIASLEKRGGVWQGEVIEVKEPHPQRIDASPHPGLDYSHMHYEHQLELKREVVVDTLWRSLKTTMDIAKVEASPLPWHYRNTIQPAVSKAGLGYRQTRSQELVILEQDPVAQAPLNQAWQCWTDLEHTKGVKELVLRCNDQADVLACFIASASEKALLPLAHHLVNDRGFTGVSYARWNPKGRFRSGHARLAGGRSIVQNYGQVALNISSTSFAQPNPAAASHLFSQLQAIAGEGEHAYDLFTGSGVIAMHLAGQFREVFAYDIDGSNLARGKADASKQGFNNIHFVKTDLRRLDKLGTADLICVDPPRSGLAKPSRQSIIKSDCLRLIYVSCDVATWARDVAHFLAEGFKISYLQAFDFYPQTHHIELLSLLER